MMDARFSITWKIQPIDDMKSLCFAQRMAAILSTLCAASHAFAVSPEIAEDLAKPKITRIDRSLAAMPANLKNSMKKVFRERKLSIADPGHPYLDTDFIVDPAKAKLPARRLALAFATPRFYYVYYRAGGYENAGKLLAFKIVGGRYQFAWGGAEFEDDPRNPDEVIKRVRRHSFDDSKKIFW
jgi:hypothetical protein